MCPPLQRTLADTKQELQSTRAQLDVTQHLVAEKEYLVGRLHHSETALVKHAAAMRDELEGAVEEVQQLHTKIGE